MARRAIIALDAVALFPLVQSTDKFKHGLIAHP